MGTILNSFLDHLRNINLIEISLGDISLVIITFAGIIIAALIAVQSNKNNISSIISGLKDDYEKVVFDIEKASIEMGIMLSELNNLKGKPEYFVKKSIPEILYNKKKYGNYQRVRLFYEALGCYVITNKSLFKQVFILFTFFDDFCENNEKVIKMLRDLKWPIADYCSYTKKLYKRYKCKRKILGKINKVKNFFHFSCLKSLKAKSKPTQCKKHILKPDNLSFESVAAFADGKVYTTRMRELQSEDSDRITQIVRNYSENATLLLYTKYRERREQTIQDIRESGLDKVLTVFEFLDKHYQEDINILQRLMTTFPDEELFSPYGPIQAPFAEGVKHYIDTAIQERNNPNRDTFRMGIEIEGSLIGGFVFDLIRKKLGDYICIGDLGAFTEHTAAARPAWLYALYPAIFLMDNFVKGYKDKGENLYISATTHLCNSETQKTFVKERGFIELGHNIPTVYGPRRTFVCKYSDFIEKFLPWPEKLNIKITNTLFEGEINWPPAGNTQRRIV